MYMTTLHWESGTAYDFFISLQVLHQAAAFGLRPSWAAGVRQRLSAVRREYLEAVWTFAVVPLDWIHALPEPRESATALRAAADLEAAARFEALTLPAGASAEVRAVLQAVAARGKWSAEEKDFLQKNFDRRGERLKPAGLDNLLRAWCDPAGAGERLLSSLDEYARVFFAEEETRLRPALGRGLERARELAGRRSVARLVEELSRGVQFEELSSVDELILAPSYWSTPLVFRARPRPGQALIVFGARLEVESVAPGAETPDALVNALKSLADPTRLRILRYLAGQPLSPTALALRLRLRPPTVIHHLQSLRLAGLVTVIVSEQGERRYAARLEALAGITSSLQDFLNQTE
jgi:DNA-binding transcriptional ArsR family regulator